MSTAPGQLDLDLGALAGSARDRRSSAGALDAGDDRVGDSVAVVRHAGRVESTASVTDEPGENVGADLDVDVDLVGVRVADRVRRGLAQRREKRRLRLVERRVADGDHLDAHLVVDLDGRRHHLDRGDEARRLSHRPAAVEPGSQLAFLAAGQRDHPPRIVGALDQHQRLQHRVVEMGGEGGTLLLTDAQRPFRVEALEQPAERRSGDHRDATEGDCDRARRSGRPL